MGEVSQVKRAKAGRKARASMLLQGDTDLPEGDAKAGELN